MDSRKDGNVPLPGKGLTNWMIQSVAANKLRLYPAANNETPIESPRSPFAAKQKKLLLVLAIGLAVGLLVKGYFFSTRCYRAEGRIAIGGVGEDRLTPILQRHLLAIQNGELTVAPDEPDEKIYLRALMETGRASIFASDPKTISLLITDSDRKDARELASQFCQAYVGQIAARNAVQGRKLSDDQAQLLRQYKQLQKDRSALKTKADAIAEGLPGDSIETYLARMTQTLESRIAESDKLLETMNRVNADISHYRSEIVHPTIKIDEQRLSRMKESDRRYNGDHGLLQNKHAMYLANLKPEMQGLTDALETLRTHLRAMAQAVTKQLQMKLPDTLSDDLLEMSLAIEQYEGQLARFQERWTRYGEKLLTMLAQSESADFDGMQTLLSQLRQDLLQRSSQLPNHLNGLYQQLCGSRSEKGKRGKLSSVTARNVAGSAITGDLAQTLEAWRKLEYHLTRLFTDGNVQLLTLGRICRSLQARLRFRDGQLRQELETQLAAAQKREAQVQLNSLQREFEQTSQSLVKTFQTFSTDQRQLAETTRRWPGWQKATDSLRLLDDRMASLEKKLNEYTDGQFQPETLEARPVVVQSFNLAGLSPTGENIWSVILSLAAAILTMAIVIPSKPARYLEHVLNIQSQKGQ
jgi:hypothetical protein